MQLNIIYWHKHNTIQCMVTAITKIWPYEQGGGRVSKKGSVEGRIRFPPSSPFSHLSHLLRRPFSIHLFFLLPLTLHFIIFVFLFVRLSFPPILYFVRFTFSSFFHFFIAFILLSLLFHLFYLLFVYLLFLPSFGFSLSPSSSSFSPPFSSFSSSFLSTSPFLLSSPFFHSFLFLPILLLFFFLYLLLHYIFFVLQLLFFPSVLFLLLFFILFLCYIFFSSPPSSPRPPNYRGLWGTVSKYYPCVCDLHLRPVCEMCV